MKSKVVCWAFALVSLPAAAMSVESGPLRVTADEIAADRKNEALVASGRVDVVSAPYRMMSAGVEKRGDKLTLADPTSVTTCTNGLDRLHWRATGAVEYKDGNYIVGRNMTAELFGIPCLWLPYWYYPIEEAEGLRLMPGYASRWGAYILSKYVYHIAGDRTGLEGDMYSLKGATRVDLRTKNGVAVGQSLRWRLGEYGKGHIKGYFAWDEDYTHYRRHWNDNSKYHYNNWGSEVDRERWAVEFAHRWDVTERDVFRVKAMVTSDSYMRRDFLRRSTMSIQNQYLGEGNNEMALEHNENSWGAGVSVSGPLTGFYNGTASLPEIYLDLMPQQVFSTPLNYEGSLRLGYLRRQSARYGKGTITAFSYQPGHWADYGTFRLDTYHRLTAPFKLYDLVSVVPRIGLRGTYYGESGYENLSGWGKAGKTGDDAFRTIVEGGVTFAARGVAWIDDEWQSVIEPYADVLAQKANISGLGKGKRLYVFDSIDASRDWSDQFAGRGRNLPYTYCGITPGFRKLLRTVDERGEFRTVFDFDAYAAMQFGTTSWEGRNKYHRLAKNGKSNYGEDAFTIMPGLRTNWYPAENMGLGLWLEYDTENDKLAFGDIKWRHALTRRFSYYANLGIRDHRWWDFSSTPRDATMHSEDFNWAHFRLLEVGFEHEICDAFAWSPYVRWDFREHELDEVGGWFEYRTDCLGFRLRLAYQNDFVRVDGSKYDDDYRIEFLMYLRAFGPEMADVARED